MSSRTEPGSQPTRPFNPFQFSLIEADTGRVRTTRVRPGWVIRLAVRSVRRASLATGGDGCQEGAWEVARYV